MVECVNLAWSVISSLLLRPLRQTTPLGPVEIFANRPGCRRPLPVSLHLGLQQWGGAIATGIPRTGPGLSMVRKIGDQTVGRIRATSRLGEGSSFTACSPTHRLAPS